MLSAEYGISAIGINESDGIRTSVDEGPTTKVEGISIVIRSSSFVPCLPRQQEEGQQEAGPRVWIVELASVSNNAKSPAPQTQRGAPVSVYHQISLKGE